jgi:hypothetical protein
VTGVAVDGDVDGDGEDERVAELPPVPAPRSPAAGVLPELR